jgi:tRNA A37 N6-isopentenylltransferase MiaA
MPGHDYYFFNARGAKIVDAMFDEGLLAELEQLLETAHSP